MGDGVGDAGTLWLGTVNLLFGRQRTLSENQGAFGAIKYP
jgi:hypothetical protein